MTAAQNARPLLRVPWKPEDSMSPHGRGPDLELKLQKKQSSLVISERRGF